MAAFTGFLKPCYVFAPRTLVRRIGMTLFGPEQSIASVRLPWGAVIEVNADETIGRELLHQNVFDIAVSETAWRLLKGGDLAVDVGANIGYLTTLFAARAGSPGRVESFEPHPRIFGRLRNNVSRLGGGGASWAPIALHECALGGRNGKAHLVEPGAFRMNEGTSTLAQRPEAEAAARARGFEVRLARLDTVLANREVALLKVDVEGFEAEVLHGAGSLLSQHKIRNIIYEAHDRERSPLHEMLTTYGYSIFGIGHDLFGLRITPGTVSPRIDSAWESPSYLATLDPDEALSSLRPRGWQVLRRC
ncbi:MAG: FkbM family methyltransferase [Steroidobacteraceae bacterium]